MRSGVGGLGLAAAVRGADTVADGCSGYPEGCVHAQETGNGSPSYIWSPDLGLRLAGRIEAHTVHAQETGNPSCTWSLETPSAPLAIVSAQTLWKS